jgi:hypothetical protein
MHAFLSTQSTFATTVTVQRRAGLGARDPPGCVYTGARPTARAITEVTAADEWWGLVLDHFLPLVRSSRPTSGRRSGNVRREHEPGVPRAGVARGSRDRMAVTDDRPVADQLAELGAQLAWVRDYL